MILVLHIATAFVSIAVASYAFFSPSKLSIRLASALATFTLVSGTYLVFQYPAHLVEACVMGLIYFALVSYGIVVARRKLVRI